MLIPEVKNVMNWKEALAFAKGLDVVLIPYELAQGMKETREILAAIQLDNLWGFLLARKAVLRRKK